MSPACSNTGGEVDAAARVLSSLELGRDTSKLRIVLSISRTSEYFMGVVDESLRDSTDITSLTKCCLNDQAIRVSVNGLTRGFYCDTNRSSSASHSNRRHSPRPSEVDNRFRLPGLAVVFPYQDSMTHKVTTCQNERNGMPYLPLIC